MTKGTTAFILAALLFMAMGPGKPPPCPCNFRIEAKGFTSSDSFLLGAFKFTGEGFSKRTIEKFRQEVDLVRGMDMDTTRAWVKHHIPCGTDKFCVDRVRFVPIASEGASPGYMLLYIEMRKRE